MKFKLTSLMGGLVAVMNPASLRKTVLGKAKFFTVTLVLLLASSLVKAATITIAADKSWSTITTGTGPGGLPSATDDIIINNNSILTVDVTNGVCKTISLTQTGNKEGTLSFLNSTSKITVSGTITFLASNDPQTILMTNGGTLNCQGFSGTNISFTPGSGSVELTATNTLPALNLTTFNNLTVSGGTTTLSGSTTVNGVLTINSGASLDVSATNYALNVAGNWTNNGIFIPRGGTVTMNGSALQVLSGNTNFSSLTVANSLNVNSNINISSTLTINAGKQINPAAGVILNNSAPAGTLTGSGTVNVTRTTGPADYSNQYKFTTNTLGGITVNYIGAGDQIISPISYGNLTVSTNGTRTVTLGTSGTIGISGTFLPTNTTTTYVVASSTVDFNGTGPQSVPNFTYNNLTASGSNTKSLGGTSAIVNGTLTVNSTFSNNGTGSSFASNNLTVNNGGTFRWNLLGAPTITGAVTLGNSSTFEYYRNGDQDIAAYSYGNLSFNGTGNKTLLGSASVFSNLSLTNGIVKTGTNTLTVESGAGINGASNNSYVDGKLSIVFSNAGSKTYPIGKGGNYRPLTLNFTSFSNGPGTFSAEQFESGFSGSAPLGTAQIGTRYWNISKTSGTPTFTYDITLVKTGITSSPGSAIKILKYDSPNTLSLATSAADPNYTASGLNSFSDFAFGESIVTTATTSTNPTSIVYGTTSVNLISTISPAPSGGSVQFYINGSPVGSPVTVSSGTATLPHNPSTLSVGTYTVRGDFSGNGAFTTATGTDATLNITARPLTATSTIAPKVYDGSPATGTVSLGTVTGLIGSETLVITPSASNYSDANVGNGKATTISYVLADGTGLAANYSMANLTSSGDITAVQLTPAITANDKAYDGSTTATLSAQSVSGYVTGETVTLIVGAANFDTKNIGTGKTVTASTLSLGGADAGNYVLATGATATDEADITAVQLTPAITANDKAYDGSTTATLSAQSVSGYVTGETVTLIVGAANFDTKNIGTGKTVTASTLSLGGADAGNYVLAAAATATDLADITAVQLTPAITANDKAYDGSTTATLSAQSVSGYVTGETVTLIVGAANFDTKNIGTGKTVTASTLSLGGADAGNYVLAAAATATDLADITAVQLTPAITANDKAYDGSTTATLSAQSVSGYVTGETVTLIVGAANFDTKNIGTGKTVTASTLSLGGADAGNYVLATGATATDEADITAVQLTPAITANDKAYDGSTTATLSAQSVSGYVTGETVTLIVGAANFDTKNIGTGKTVTASTLSLGGADAGNYVLAAAATATDLADITAVQLTPAITANDKAYDGSTTATLSAQSVSGYVTGETVTLIVGAANFDTKNIGTGKTVTASTLSLGGADAGNYVLATGATATDEADITAVQLTPAITANDKAYDGSTTATLSAQSVSGYVTGETVTLIIGAANFDTKNIGTGKTVTASTLSLGGADAGNYVLATGATATDEADITAVQLTPAITANDKAYDGSTTATLSAQSVSGYVTGETVTLIVGAANFDTKNIGTGKTVTASTLSLGGADAGNYVLATGATATDEADITAVQLTPAITANDKAYDGSTTATLSAQSVSGYVTGETVTLIVGAANFDTKNIGTGKTVTASTLSLGGADAGNYVLATGATATDEADITAVQLTPAITANDKAYDGSTTATLSAQSVSGYVAGETVTLIVGAANFDTKNIGTGKTVTASTLSLGGADAGNYVLAAAATATDLADITAVQLTPAITANDKAYDGSTTATLSAQSVSGYVAGETVTLIVGAANFDTKNIGTGKTVTASTLSLGGADAGNYVLAAAATATDLADITAVQLTPAITANDKAYDGSTTATLSAQSVSGYVTGETVTLIVGAANFDTKNIGTGKTVTASTLSLGGADAGNYVLAAAATATDLADITAVQLTPAITANDKAYDGSTTATLSAQSVSGYVTGETVTLIVGAANFDTKNIGTGKTVTASTLSLGGADAGNYVLATGATATDEADITAVQLTPAITANDKAYDGSTTATLSAQSVSGYVTGETVTLIVGAANFDTKNIGTGKTVTASTLSLGGADAGNYVLAAAATATDLADITAVQLTPAITANDKAYDGSTTATLSAQSVSGYVTGETVTLIVGAANFDTKNIGTGKTVTASTLSLGGADAGNYVLATGATATDEADITAVQLTPAITANDKAYDGSTTATLSAQSVSGYVTGETVTLIIGAANFDTKNIGTGKTVTASTLSLGGADAGNYVLATGATATDEADITAVQLTPAITANDKAYDGSTTATLSAQSVSGYVTGETVTLIVGAANFDTKNIGTGKTVTASTLSLGGADAGNYVLATGATATDEADITAVQLTPAITANDKAYDGSTTATLSAQSVSGYVTGETVTLIVGAANFDTKNIGTGKTVTASTLSLGGADAGNYVLATGATATDEADITAVQLTPAITANDKAYDGSTTATLSAQSVSGYVAGETVTLIVGAANFDTKNIGTGKTVTASTLSLGGADAGNYVLAAAATATDLADITAVQLTPAITANDKAYDGSTTATLSAQSVSGYVAGETVTLIVGAANFDTKNIGTGKTVTASTLSLGGADAGNYVLATGATATDEADITAVQLTPAITANDKAYDGSTTATLSAQSVSGYVAGETVTLIVGAANFDTKNIGNGKTVTASTLSLGGADAGNYVLAAAATATDLADITAVQLTPAITANDKAYDGSTTATLSAQSVSGYVAGETVTLIVGAANFDTKNIGNGKTVTASTLSLGGADAGNYVLATGATATDEADITAVQLTPAITANDKAYDGSTTATLSAQSVSGYVTGETVTLIVGAANFDTKNIGTGKTVTASTLSLGGADAGNYVLATGATATDEADITAVQLTPAITANDKAYDGSTTATLSAQSVSGYVTGETVTLIVGAANFDTKNIGTGKTVTASTLSLGGADAGNYVLATGATATDEADITAVQLTPAITANDKAYDGSTTATLSAQSVSGYVTGETVTLIVGAANFDTKNIGTGKTVTASTLSLGGADAGNYVLAAAATATDLADITAVQLTPAITANDKAYDGSTTATLSAQSVSGYVAGETVTLIVGAANFDTKNIGNGKTVTASTLSLGGADAGNYVLAAAATATDLADITAVQLTPAITANDKAYDGSTTATLSAQSVSGYVAGETVTLIVGAANFDTKNIGTGKTVTASTLSLGGADAGNYVLAAAATATDLADITAVQLTPAITANDKAYDGSTTATLSAQSVSGYVAGETVTLIVGAANFDTKNIGTGKTVTASTLSLGGADAGNYVLAAAATATDLADITAVQLTPAITANDKAYDGSTTATLSAQSVSGYVAGETVTLIVGAANFDTKNIGTGKTVTASTLSLGGADAGNYVLATGATATDEADITAVQLTPAITANDKAYDGSTTATLSAQSVSGYVTGETVTLIVGAANFDTKNIGTGKTVTASTLSLGGADAGNYVLATGATATDLADITARPITITASANTKTYDGTTAAAAIPTITTGTLAPGDAATFSETYDTKNQGSGKTMTPAVVSILDAATADMAPNYNVTLTSSSNGVINYAILTYTATLNNKIYGELNPSFNGTITGFVSGENQGNATTGIAVFNTVATQYSQVESYAIYGSGLSANNGNYSFAQAASNENAFTIDKRPLNLAGTKVYNATVNFAGTQLSPGNIVNSDPVTLGGSATVSSKNIGSYTSFNTNLLTSSNANYKVTGGTINVSITPATLTYTSNAASKIYGNVNPSLSGAVTGFASGENAGNATTGTAVYATTATQFSNADSYAITGSGLTANNGNYTFVQAAGNATSFTINQRPLNFTGTRMYDGTTTFNAAILTAGNIVNGNIVTLSGSANVPTILSNPGGVGTYTSFVTNNLLSSNSNYKVTDGTVNVTITPQTASPVGDAYYTGPSFYWTTGTGSKTANLTLTATIKNNVNFTGDIRTARVSFYINNNGTLSPITGAQNLPVGLVNPGDLSTGTASKIVQYNIGSATVTSLHIAVRITGNYQSINDPATESLITIAEPKPGGLIVGGGKLCNDNSAGYVKGAPNPERADYSFYVQYNKSLTNPQGGVEIFVSSYNDRNGNPTSVLHNYKMKSTAISTLAVNSPTAQFSGKANIVEIVNGVDQSIEGNCIMQMELYDSAAPGATAGSVDQLGVTIFRKSGGIWFSNNWIGTRTEKNAICGGEVNVTGGGAASTIIATSTQPVMDQPLKVISPTIEKIKLTAYPNPFAKHATVGFTVPENEQKVTLDVYDLRGIRVNRLYEGKAEANQPYSYEFDGSNLSPGVYLIRLSTSKKVETFRVIMTE